MSTAIANNQAEIIGRAIDSRADELSAEVANFILSLNLAAEDERRMNELAVLARQGQLASAEESELEEFRRCGRLMEILKLKARKALDSK